MQFKVVGSHESSVHGLRSSQVNSSICPLQSSSTPLQVSGTGVGALQDPRPSSVQIRGAMHVPSSLVFLQLVLCPFSMENKEHSQVPSIGMHKLAVWFARIVIVSQTKPAGQFTSSEQVLAQKDPSELNGIQRAPSSM